MELRCDGTMHAVVDFETRTFEVRCKRRRCGAAPGVVVLHTFCLDGGRLLSTKRFADPAREEQHGTGEHAAVRSA